MKNKLRSSVVVLLICITISNSVFAQLPFNKGVNLTQWFETNTPGGIQLYKYTKKDFQDIKSLGCDVVRLPIRLNYMTLGEPDFTLDPLFLSFLDSVVSWATETDMHLILDNHTFDPAINTSPLVGDTLEIVWKNLAEYYADGYENLYYEVLNEPHGIDDGIWGTIQGKVIDAIREVDGTHTIIVGPANWNSFHNLQHMPEYSDTNLIYTFHFYDPFLFTHQGADWTDPSMAPVAGIPFPYAEEDMPEVPAPLENTWIENEYNSYDTQGTAQKMREMMQMAADFSSSRDVPIFCGEFGAYTINSNTADRVAYFDTLSTIFEEFNILWTIWGYDSGFGFFEPGGQDLFEHDIDTQIVASLGLIPPPQTDYVLIPDSTGFTIFNDYLGPNLISHQFLGGGVLDYYSETSPNNDNYCIDWNAGAQYSSFGFNFSPYKDISYLVENDYALDFFVRGLSDQNTIDIRFVDTDTDDPEDHPWRRRYQIGNANMEWNGKWHHFHIPLEDFVEQGSWDDNTWFEPDGKFDWTAVDMLEIVSETRNSIGDQFWFDNMYITNLDTAMVLDTSTIVDTTNVINNIEESLLRNSLNLSIHPNPVKDYVNFEYALDNAGYIALQIFDMNGRPCKSIVNSWQESGSHKLSWDVVQENGEPFPSGLYYCTFTKDDLFRINKTILVLP